MYCEGQTVYLIRGRFEAFVKKFGGETLIIIRQECGKTLSISLPDYRILTGNFKLITMCFVNSMPEEFEICGEKCKFERTPDGAALSKLLKIVVESIEEKIRISLQSINISFTNGVMVLANKGKEEEFRFRETDYRMLYALRKEIVDQIIRTADI